MLAVHLRMSSFTYFCTLFAFVLWQNVQPCLGQRKAGDTILHSNPKVKAQDTKKVLEFV